MSNTSGRLALFKIDDCDLTEVPYQYCDKATEKSVGSSTTKRYDEWTECRGKRTSLVLHGICQQRRGADETSRSYM